MPDHARRDGAAEEHLGGRLALLATEQLDPRQARLHEQLAATRVSEAADIGFQAQLPDGRLIGPFNALLYTPMLADAIGAWAAAIESFGLPPDACQAAILAVGVAWDADYEIYAHVAEARHAGVPDDAIRSIVAGEHPSGLSVAADVAHRLARALVIDHAVADDLYDEAAREFGVAGLIALVNLIGRYLNTAALLTCFRVPAPRG